jgi:hypothetical protein
MQRFLGTVWNCCCSSSVLSVTSGGCVNAIMPCISCDALQVVDARPASRFAGVDCTGGKLHAVG